MGKEILQQIKIDKRTLPKSVSAVFSQTYFPDFAKTGFDSSLIWVSDLSSKSNSSINTFSSGYLPSSCLALSAWDPAKACCCAFLPSYNLNML